MFSLDIKELISESKDYIIEMRRYFHKYPELSFKEFETTKKIASELEKMGIPYQIPEEEPRTGVIGIIEGKQPGKAVALRADIDALNVKEENDVDYKSRNVGKMHACGHDNHIAMLLGAARILSQVKNELHGKVYLIFQPAEELGLGAKYMMRQGDWYDNIDNIYGSHVWSGLESGKISVEAGERMAAADKFTITIKGKSGHGSLPHETVDAVVVGAAVVQNMQQLVSRNYSPLDSVTVTIGSFHSGNRFNIIAGDATLEGTNRYFSKEIGSRIENDMKRILNGVCEAYGAEGKLDYEYIVSPTSNDEESSKIAENALLSIAGKDALQKMTKTTGGEDFSFYLEGKPGCFGFVGISNDKIGANYPQHSEHYNVDEEALINGAGLYAKYAIDYLNEFKQS